MNSFRQMRSKVRLPGFHSHHIIPRQVVERQAFARFFGNVRSLGFLPNDFSTNGIYLPCTEELAEVFALPLHRGSHRLYNELVSEHVARLATLPVQQSLRGLGELQTDLRQALRRSGKGKINLIRNPMRSDLERDMENIGLLGDLRARIVRIP